MRVLQVLTRVYVAPEVLASTIIFYESLFQEACTLRFTYPTAGLELAQVGGILCIAGTDASLVPFLETRLTLLVDDIDAYRNDLEARGAQILAEPKAVPTGRNMRIRHPDGLVVEYVEHVTVG